MNRHIERAIFVTVFFAGLAGTQAKAERITVQCPRSEAVGGGRISCSGVGQIRFNSEGSSAHYVATVAAPSSHCSDVSYTAYNARSDVKSVSPRLVPGQSARLDLRQGYGIGPAQVQLTAIGFVGGCNQGRMSSWAVDVTVQRVP